jgi:hypothetical protein
MMMVIVIMVVVAIEASAAGDRIKIYLSIHYHRGFGCSDREKQQHECFFKRSLSVSL